MIFEVYLDDKLLYYPNDETFVITNSTLELALNEAGSFEFDVPNFNLRYDDFYLRKSMISVRQNDVEIFYGEVREITENFDFTKHIYTVGELAFLFDSIQPPKLYKSCTPRQMLESILNYHNSQVESRKKFKLGYVNSTVASFDKITNREDSLTTIRDILCEGLDLYLRIRKDNGQKFLDLVPLANYGKYCLQEIQFGENLITYSKNITASDIATCVIPLGARLEDEQRTGTVPDELDESLTIIGTSVNDYHKRKENDYVQIDSAIAQFGYVRVVKEFNEITDKEILQKKAIEWLKSVQYETMILELNAFDMNLLDANIDSFDVGDTIHAWALPFGMDTNFPVQKKTIYLNSLEQNKVVLGNSCTDSYTKQASNAIEKLMEDLPEISPILKSAKDNALAMLLAETTGGHVVYEYDKTNSYIEAINVINATEIKNATQRWVWNLNGLGYMSRKNTSDKWTDLKVAMTMDGQIVANFITTGEMSADHIKGGTLEVGGTGYSKDGSIVVKNASGTALVTLNKNGMTLSNGQQIKYTDISDPPTIPSENDIKTISTTITENTISTHTFYGNSYYATKNENTGKFSSWFAPDGVIDEDFNKQSIKFKVDGSYPFLIDSSGRTYSSRFIAGDKGVGAESGWGTQKHWTAMIGGSLYTHKASSNKYYGVTLEDLGGWIEWINICIDQNRWVSYPQGNPIKELDATVFNG